MQISFIELNWIENHTLQALNYVIYIYFSIKYVKRWEDRLENISRSYCFIQLKLFRISCKFFFV